MPLHNSFLSHCHPLDLQAHPKTATLSDNTTHRVNGIQAYLQLEVWIQFPHSSQFGSPYCFLYCARWDSSEIPNLPAQYASLPVREGLTLDVKLSYETSCISNQLSSSLILVFWSMWQRSANSACNMGASSKLIWYVISSMKVSNLAATSGVVTARMGSRANGSGRCPWAGVVCISRGGRALNSPSPTSTTSVLHWQSLDIHFALYSSTL